MRRARPMNDSFLSIRDVLHQAQSIAIMAHQNPDGDAIGASCALGLALKEAGKDVTVFLESYGDVFSMIPTGDLVCHQGPEGMTVDVAVALDCGDKERIGLAGTLFSQTENTINIDHHISNQGYGKFSYVDGNASSASELVYDLLSGWLPLNPEIATALYTGLVFDTGGFRHSSTGVHTMEIAARLMAFDVPFTKIYNDIFFSRSLAEAKALGKALAEMEVLLDGKALLSALSLEDLSRLGAGPADTSEISGYLKGVRPSQVAALCYEKEPGVWKVSMRSEDSVDVSALCVSFGGGGHKKAAGCTIRGTKEEVLATIREALQGR